LEFYKKNFQQREVKVKQYSN